MAKVVKVRLSSEWGARPTWVINADGDLDDVAPAMLGLSADLAVDIEAWDGEFQALYNPDDPGSSADFGSNDGQSSWIARGKELSERIAHELSSTPVEFRYHGTTYSSDAVEQR